jgi:hypothetical protein
MKSKSITSVTYILIGNMLLTYNNFGSGWTATLTAFILIPFGWLKIQEPLIVEVEVIQDNHIH